MRRWSSPLLMTPNGTPSGRPWCWEVEIREAHAVRKKPAAHAVRKKPAAHAVRKKPAAHAVRKKPAARAVRKKPAAHAVRKKPAAQAVRKKSYRRAVRKNSAVGAVQKRARAHAVRKVVGQPRAVMDGRPKASARYHGRLLPGEIRQWLSASKLGGLALCRRPMPLNTLASP
jgi:hypothetical protein